MMKKNGLSRRLSTAIIVILWFNVASAFWPYREPVYTVSRQLGPSLEFTIEDLMAPSSAPPSPPPPSRPSLPGLLWPQKQKQQKPRDVAEDEDVQDEAKEARLSVPRLVWPRQPQQKPRDEEKFFIAETEEARSSPTQKTQKSEMQEVKQQQQKKESVVVNSKPSVNQTSAVDRRNATGPLLSFNRRQGRLDLEMKGLHSSRNGRPARRIHDKDNTPKASPFTKYPPLDPDAVTVSVDPSAVVRLLWYFSQASGSLGLAMLGTLRLLAPLIVARRGLNWLGDIFNDWYTGRYLRKTYKRMEHNYWRFYQVPAVLRSTGRLVAQLALLMTLGKVMENWVGLSHSPCVVGSGGCYWWCGILWIVAVVGTGHAGAAAIAMWGGPLRIQMPSDVLAQRRPSKRQVLTHPWHILLWLRDPDQWISEFATSRRDSATQLKPFHPDPLIFPVTYEPLRILQMVTIAKEMALNQSMMHSIMRQVLIQQAMGDEWFRVLLLERRVTLGVAVMVGYIWSTFSLFWTVARASRLSALLLLPSVFA
jgi:tryptophan-rich sensory protein